MPTEIDVALADLRNQDRVRQYEAIQTLAKMASPEGDLALLCQVAHRSPDVRLDALEALRERDASLAQIAARATLDDPQELVRTRAADVLGAVGTRHDFRRLKRALETDESWSVRSSAADSLGVVAKKAALPALLRAMRNDPNAIVRRDAAYAVSYARDSSVISTLEAALAEEQAEQARLGLLEALYALGESKRLPEMLALLQSGDSLIRYATVNGLSEILRPEDRLLAIAALEAMLETEEPPGLRTDTQTLISQIR